MPRHLSPIVLLILSACGVSWELEDGDGDGISAADGDCWDASAGPEGSGLAGGDIHPGADEIWYDGIDGDCAGGSDYDADQDGYDTSAHGGLDCDDEDAATSPDATEVWYDGADQDCDGNDADQDGDGYVLTEDCDDEDASKYPDPSVDEVWYNGVDEDCDGNDGDQDGDGYTTADYAWDWTDFNGHLGEGDCWDDPAQVPAAYVPIDGYNALASDEVHPGADERYYDAVDQDCAGDDDFDQDDDGWRSDSHPNADGAVGEDCYDGPGDDFDDVAGLGPAAVNPGETDTWYDGTDADCGGEDDYDQDRDGFGAEAAAGGSQDDCDDEDADVSPGAFETCDTEVDDDCDGSINEANADGCARWYADSDGDGYGTGTYSCLCGASGLYTASTLGDCDDADAGVSPGAQEICDAADEDEDCDGLSDDEDSSTDTSTGTTTWTDADGDGFGDAEAPVSACDGATGTVADDTDCDDADADRWPGAPEVCEDAVVNDCEGGKEDATDACQLSGALALADADAAALGGTAGDGLGSVMAVLGDLDADGAIDLGIAAPDYGSSRGAVYLVDGPMSAGTLSTSLFLRGDATTDALGTGLAAAGDVDGDGYDDALMGSPYGSFRYSDEGVVYLVDGPITSTTAVDNVYQGMAYGNSSGVGAGSALSGGDVDGDGTNDTVVGAPLMDVSYGGEGVVFLIDGNDMIGAKAALTSLFSLFVYGSDSDAALGSALTASADVDGDGMADLGLGAPGACASTSASGCPGAVYVVLGGGTGYLDASSADATWLGTDDGDRAGAAVADAGDLDGDGYGDLLMGAPANDDGGKDAGAAYAVFGDARFSGGTLSSADASFTGAALGDGAGAALAHLDADGDGAVDVLVGAPGADDGGADGGVAALSYGPVSGATGLGSADWALEGAAGEAAGTSLLGADLDGDGLDDVGVGAPGVDPSSRTDAGSAVFVFATDF